MALRGDVSGSASSTGSFGQIKTDRIHIGRVGGSTANIVIGDANTGRDQTGGASASTILIGVSAGKTLTTGDKNICIGISTGAKLTTGIKNVLVGNEIASLGASMTGNQNVVIGHEAAEDLTSGTQNVYIGANAGHHAGIGNTNVAIGAELMQNNHSGSGNIAIGYRVLAVWGIDTNAGNHIAMGSSTFNDLRKGTQNIAIGNSSHAKVTSVDNSIGIGEFTLAANISQSNMLAIGSSAMGDAYSNGSTTAGQGGASVAIGLGALKNIQVGSNNIAIGNNTNQNARSGSQNIHIGYRVHHGITGGKDAGDSNITIGHLAGQYSSGSSNNKNITMGYIAGRDNNGFENVFIGNESAKLKQNGDNNTFLGSDTGDGYVEYDTTTLIGKAAEANATGESNQTVLGANAIGNGSNTVTIGDDNVTEVHMSEDGGAEMFANGTINTSDRRFKENIDDSDLGLEFINKVRPVKYKFKEDKHSGKMKYGIIAQEVQEVLINLDKEDTSFIETDNPDKLGADYVQFIAPLIKSVQELTEMVKAQQKEIEELKKQ